MAAGFVHGVLNSDNINVTGESFDYGPWRFAPSYDPSFTAAYFDQTGLYAFGRQPGALGWNLTCLAECLLPLTGLEPAEKALAGYQDMIQQEFRSAVLDRLGLSPVDLETDARLAKSLIEFLAETYAPFEQFFFDWRCGSAGTERAQKSCRAVLSKGRIYAVACQSQRASGLAHRDSRSPIFPTDPSLHDAHR